MARRALQVVGHRPVELVAQGVHDQVGHHPGGAAGGVCGPGAPASWGITYWCNVRLGLEYYAYQFDIGGTEPAVAPASLGRVKALFK